VRPFAEAESMRLCRSSTLLVKVLMISARSLKLTRKNSSCGIRRLEKLQGGFLGLADFVGHTAAEIEDDADGNGDVFGEKYWISCRRCFRRRGSYRAQDL